MLKPHGTRTDPKLFLLVDAVVWSAAYPVGDPLRDVHRWYARWLSDMPAVRLVRIGAEEDVLSAARQNMSGVILSGSPRDAWADDGINKKLCELVQLCQDRSLPFLGVCYGHQILARALGGMVARHPQGLELGNTPVELTPAGEQCPLFAGFPRRFNVLSSHADAVLEMPREAELLSQGEFTKNQALQWRQLLFGVQFHPETDPETLRFLWSTRREAWRGRVNFDLDAVLDNLQPTPMAGNILRNFVTRL